MGKDIVSRGFMKPKRKKCEAMYDRLQRDHAEADSVVAWESYY
jgi:hypothetical protein